MKLGQIDPTQLHVTVLLSGIFLASVFRYADYQQRFSDAKITWRMIGK